MKIYFGGCISHHQRNSEMYKAIEWRNILAQKLSDLNADMYIKKFDWFDPTDKFDENLKYNYNTIVMQNKLYLDECDILVVNLEKLEDSPGTLFEIFYYYYKQKPVIAFGKTTDPNIINQPHINSSITEYLSNLDEVVNYIKNMYSQ